jgi:hypothetical protein
MAFGAYLQTMYTVKIWARDSRDLAQRLVVKLQAASNRIAGGSLGERLLSVSSKLHKGNVQMLTTQCEPSPKKQKKGTQHQDQPEQQEPVIDEIQEASVDMEKETKAVFEAEVLIDFSSSCCTAANTDDVLALVRLRNFFSMGRGGWGLGEVDRSVCVCVCIYMAASKNYLCLALMTALNDPYLDPYPDPYPRSIPYGSCLVGYDPYPPLTDQ